MKNYQAIELIRKYNEGTCTAEERSLVEQGFLKELKASDHMPSEERIEQAEQHIEAYLMKYIAAAQKPAVKVKKLWYRIAAAAAIFLVIGASFFFYSRYSSAPRHPDAGQDLGLASNNIKPGSNKAYLILSNGKRLSLTDAANGAIAKEAGVEITKTADGQVIYKAASDNNGDISGRHPELVSGPPLNTIETPRGGQYQIRLPDGSKVWLNAASKLIYPVSFTGRGQREVTLSGEAYFEIAKDKEHPFRVKSAEQEVEVLGTHFNVNTYTDEPTTKTTLLEGSVAVRHPELVSGSPPTVTLKPGQQASLQANKIKVIEVNVTDAIAWKNGNFVFESESIQGVMRKVARWYDVDIEYKGTPNFKQYSGTISRTENIAQILGLLEKTGTVKFEVAGKRIIVK